MYLVGKAKLAAKLGVAPWPHKPFSSVTPIIVVRLTEEKKVLWCLGKSQCQPVVPSWSFKDPEEDGCTVTTKGKGGIS